MIRWKNPRYDCWGEADAACPGKLAIVSFQRDGFTDSGVQGKLRCLECGRDYVIYSSSCEQATGPEDPPLPKWLPDAKSPEQIAAMTEQPGPEDFGGSDYPPMTKEELDAHLVAPNDPRVVEALGAFVRGETMASGVFGETIVIGDDEPSPAPAAVVAPYGDDCEAHEASDADPPEPPKRERFRNGKLWLPPPFRWAGGKRSSLPLLVPLAQQWRDQRSGVYYEPFVGGGALFWALAGMNRDLEGWPWLVDPGPEGFDDEGEPLEPVAVIGDTNLDLIRCYRGLRDDVESVIRFLLEAQENHAVDPEAYYQAVRSMEVPATEPGSNYDPLCAARFLYLLGVGFNGVWRTNSEGKNNVPLGKKGKGENARPLLVKVDADHLRTCAQALRGVRIVHGDFRETLKTARQGDLVYADPPYAAVGETADFGERSGSYGNADGFGLEEQQALLATLRRLADAGIAVIASNAAAGVIRDMYAERRGVGRVDFDVRTVQIARAINSDASKRGKVNELLITANLDQAGIPTAGPVPDEGTLVADREKWPPEVTVRTDVENPAPSTPPAPRKKKDMPTEPRIYITRVTSNLKSGDGQPWTVKLERHSLLQGPRGSGKSRVQQAIQWFFTGRLEDVAQRDPKATNELRSLSWAPEGDGGDQSSFFVELEWSDGVGQRRILGENIVPNPAILPMTVLLDALRSGSDVTRAFFLEQLQAGITEADVMQQIGEANKDRYNQIGENINHPVLKLLTVIQYCKDRAREIQRESKDAEALLQNASVMPPSQARLDELQAQWNSYEQQRKAHVYGRVKIARQDVIAWQSLLPQFPQQEPEPHPESVDAAAQQREQAYQERLRAFQLVIETCLAKSLDNCPVCESAWVEPGHWNAQHAKFKALLEQAKAEVVAQAPHREPTITVPLSDGPREMTRGEVQANLNMAVAAYRRATEGGLLGEISDEELAALGAPTLPYEAVVQMQAKVGVDLERERHALNMWTDVLRAREVQASAEQRKASWTSLQGLCEQARDTLLRMQVQQLTHAVNRYLPKALANPGFALWLGDAKRETCRVGLYRKVGVAGVVIHTALSGAEEAAVLLALAAALAERSAAPAILIPRERAFDAKALRETMRALTKSDCQIILTSTVAPAGRGSKDWSVIETLPLWEVETAEEEEPATTLTPDGPVVATGPAGEAK